MSNKSLFVSAMAAGVLLLTIGFSLTAAQGGGAVVSVLPGHQPVAAGDPFTITVNVTDATNLGGFDLTLQYDPTVVEATTATVGPFLGSTGRSIVSGPPSIDPTAGTLYFGAATLGSSPAGPTGSGILAYVVMRAVQGGQTNLHFLPWSATNIYDIQGIDIPFSTADGVATVYRVYTWTGSLNSDWSSGSNWSPSGLPTRYDDVIIPAPPVSIWPAVNVPSAVNNLTIRAGASLTIPDGSGLTVEGTLANNGTLVQVRTAPGGSTAEFLHIRNTAGTVDKYHGIDITPAGDMGLTTVRILGNQSACGGASDAALLRRCYTIDPATPQSATGRFWYTAGELNGQPANGLHIWHYDGPPGLWSEAGVGAYNYSESTAACAGDCWVARGVISHYSPFVVGVDPVGPTAVTLLKFGGVSGSNRGVLLMTLFVAGLVGGGYLMLYIHSRTRVG
jgi:hypothetical protein